MAKGSLMNIVREYQEGTLKQVEKKLSAYNELLELGCPVEKEEYGRLVCLLREKEKEHDKEVLNYLYLLVERRIEPIQACLAGFTSQPIYPKLAEIEDGLYELYSRAGSELNEIKLRAVKMINELERKLYDERTSGMDNGLNALNEIHEKVIRYVSANPNSSKRGVYNSLGLSNSKGDRRNINTLITLGYISCDTKRMKGTVGGRCELNITAKGKEYLGLKAIRNNMILKQDHLIVLRYLHLFHEPGFKKDHGPLKVNNLESIISFLVEEGLINKITILEKDGLSEEKTYKVTEKGIEELKKKDLDSYYRGTPSIWVKENPNIQ